MSVILGLATEQDLPLILAWRNNPFLYEGCYTQGRTDHLITWEEHFSWWRSRNQDWLTFVIYLDSKRPIGTLNLTQLDYWSPEIGCYIGEVTLWGKGYGKEAVKQGLNILRDKNKHYSHTTILDSNERATRLVKSLGFEYLGKAREGESWWQKKL